MQQLVADAKAQSAPRLFGTYYDTSIMMHHVTHPLFARAQRVLLNVFSECRRVERDEFLLPFFLWRYVLNATAELREPELSQRLRRCIVPGAERTTSAAVMRHNSQHPHFNCSRGRNYEGACIARTRCSRLSRTLRACQEACARRSRCAVAVFNRYHGA
jgi:hypothetical protein